MATRRLGVRAPPQYGEFPTKSPLAVAAWVGHTASPQQADTASGNFSQSQGHTGYWQRFRQGSVVDAARSCLTGKASRKAPGLPNVFAQTAVRLVRIMVRGESYADTLIGLFSTSRGAGWPHPASSNDM